MLSDMLATGWDVPLRGAAAVAAPAIDLEAFLRVMRAEEDRLPRSERLDAKLTITRLRKLFYGGRGWDEHLIPHAAGVPPLYPFSMTDPVRRGVPAPGPDVLEFVDRRPRLDGAPPELESPGELQEVRMPDGERVDVGHVLAGLDAINHRAPVAPLGIYEIATQGDTLLDAARVAPSGVPLSVREGRAGRRRLGPFCVPLRDPGRARDPRMRRSDVRTFPAP